MPYQCCLTVDFYTKVYVRVDPDAVHMLERRRRYGAHQKWIGSETHGLHGASGTARNRDQAPPIEVQMRVNAEAAS